jgi:C_GCAxxG_C_C family probable redox protein
MERDPRLDSLVIKFGKQYENCAQTSFLALQSRFNLPCDVPSFLKAIAALPGIGGMGKTCGGVTGSLLAMGLALGTADPTDKEQSKKCHAAAHQFCLAVKEQFGSTDCGDIIEHCCGKRFDLSNPKEAKEYVEAGGLMKCINVVQTSVNVAAGILKAAGKKVAEV